MFDHGLMIDHGSTDNSADICRQLAPHWQLVRSRLKVFDAWLTDFEVMTHELEISGWKIALNTTEFLVANPGLDEIERFLLSKNMAGVAASGMTMIDKQPSYQPLHSLPLVQQKPWAVDQNSWAQCFLRHRTPSRRLLRRMLRPIFQVGGADRNRFYHSLPNGLYLPGRHQSHHLDWKQRLPNLMVLHYAYAPWTRPFIDRKLQISAKIPDTDVACGWGHMHRRNLVTLQQDFDRMNRVGFIDLRSHRLGAGAIGISGFSPDAKICLLPNSV